MANRPPVTAETKRQQDLTFEFEASTEASIDTSHRSEPREERMSQGGREDKPGGRAGKSQRDRKRVTADTLAKQQREISVSEFFAKNRHLLGFDNKRKALLTTVKEAVDNSLDACEEAGILPDLLVHIEQTKADRFTVMVRDNGPGIVKQQIPNVFGKLLYGSKFHRLKMSRGQQGIGISAAGMYGLITTGKPVHIISRTGPRAAAHRYTIAIDTKKNRPDIITDDTVEVDWRHGTEVTIELVASYNKGRQSVDEYLELTAITNPHAHITYKPPDRDAIEFPRGTDMLPDETREIKPHPYGIEFGTFLKLLKDTEQQKLGGFLAHEFSRVSPATAKKVCTEAKVTPQTWVNGIAPPAAEKLYQALQNMKLKAPATDCLAPIGAEALLTGLLKGIKAEFYTASTRPPCVYRGNPFQIEVGLAYGGQLGSDKHDDEENGDNGKNGNRTTSRVIRFANRVPLLYQQSSCSLFKSVTETRWNNYGVSQSSGSIPQAPMIILIHMASVWVPYISEGKEAVADYDEIRKEVKLAIADCGRRLGLLLKRKKKKASHVRRRDVFTRYIEEVVQAVSSMAEIDKDNFRESLISLSKQYTAKADIEFDDHGKVIKKQRPGNDMGLTDTIIINREEPTPEEGMLFVDGEEQANSGALRPKSPKDGKRKKKR